MNHLRLSFFAAAVVPSLLAGLSTGCAFPPGSGSEPGEVVGSAEQNLYVTSYKKWPSGTIPVCWEQTGNATKKEWVRDAVTNSWQRQANLRFYGWGTCTSGAKGIRINIADVNPATWGIGTDLDGKYGGMDLNFTFAEWNSGVCTSDPEPCIRSIAVHEFGHALGFNHEHNRPDTPASCTMAPQGSNGDVTIGPWDGESIMNYCSTAWNNNGDLTPGDIVGVQTVYGRKLSGSIVGVDAQCLDIRGDATANSTPVQLYECKTSATANQAFHLEDGEVQTFGGNCLDTAGGSSADNTAVNIYDCHGGPNQLWSMPGAKIVAIGGKVLKVTGTLDNLRVRLAEDDGGPGEKWTFLPNGEIRGFGGKCLDVRDSGTANGTPVQIFSCNGGANQHFTLLPGGQIVGYGGLCLDVPGSVTTDGTALQMYPCNAGLNQSFSWSGEIVGIGGKCLDVPGSATANQTPLQIFGCTGGANQTFEWYP